MTDKTGCKWRALFHGRISCTRVLIFGHVRAGTQVSFATLGQWITDSKPMAAFGSRSTAKNFLDAAGLNCCSASAKPFHFQAAKAMKMSYKAAWDAVDAMNSAWYLPLVESGPAGSRLTEDAERLITEFSRPRPSTRLSCRNSQMACRRSRRATRDSVNRLHVKTDPLAQVSSKQGRD